MNKDVKHIYRLMLSKWRVGDDPLVMGFNTDPLVIRAKEMLQDIMNGW